MVVHEMKELSSWLGWRQGEEEYWSRLPCPPPGDLPDPGIELASPALQVDSFPLSHRGNPSQLLEDNLLTPEKTELM